MSYLQKFAKSLILPISCLPIASILIGIGYFLKKPLERNEIEFLRIIAELLIVSGNAIIKSIPLLFALGVSVGMTKNNEGISALSGLISWIIFQAVLSPYNLGEIFDDYSVNLSFFHINNSFIGILSGLIASFSYNKFKNIEFSDFLSFFNGKRFVAIVTSFITLFFSAILLFSWPYIYMGLMKFANFITSLGAFGAGIYGFLNRFLIPTGLHHTLNSIFWFDVAGINDLGNFWTANGNVGEVGQYMTGFFPITMFALPAVALAMYKTSIKENKKDISKVLLTASICSFFTGVTETIEFAFIFLSPVLFIVHCVLTGLSMFISALLPFRAGLNFSGGFIDLILSSGTPMALNVWYVFPIGLGFAFLYYHIFRFLIIKLKLKTIGRDTINENYEPKENSNFEYMAKTILEGLGGYKNIKSLDNCITRLRIEVFNPSKVDAEKIKSCKIAGIFYPSKRDIHIVIGNNAQFVAEKIKEMYTK